MNEWNKLSMRDRAAIIRAGVSQGITDIDNIRLLYDLYNGDINLFSKGGAKNKKKEAPPSISNTPVVLLAMKFFMDKGLSLHLAAGLVGNLYRESRFNTKALNSGSAAYGIALWLGPRKQALFKKYGNNPTLLLQLDFVWHELNTTHKRGLTKLKESKTAEEAARNAFGYYEFSAGPEGAIKAMNKSGLNGLRSMLEGIDFAKLLIPKVPTKRLPTLVPREFIDPKLYPEYFSEADIPQSTTLPLAYILQLPILSTNIPTTYLEYALETENPIYIDNDSNRSYIAYNPLDLLLLFLKQLPLYSTQSNSTQPTQQYNTLNIPLTASEILRLYELLELKDREDSLLHTLFDDNIAAYGGELGNIFDGEGPFINLLLNNGYSITPPTTQTPIILPQVSPQVSQWHYNLTNRIPVTLDKDKQRALDILRAKEYAIANRTNTLKYFELKDTPNRVASNDVTAVKVLNPTTGSYKPINSHLDIPTIEGAQSHRAFELDYPTLSTMGNALGAVPLATASLPFVAATAPAALTNPYINAGLISLGGSHAAHSIYNGEADWMTALELAPFLSPLVGPAGRMIEKGYNAAKNSIFPVETSLGSGEVIPTAMNFEGKFRPVGKLFTRVANALENPINTNNNLLSITDAEWDAAYNAAREVGNMEEALRIADLHFLAKSGTSTVDNSGMPLHVYHGSPSKNITEFKHLKSQEGGRGTGTEGFYTSPNRDYADRYLARHLMKDVEPFNGRTYDLYLNTKNTASFPSDFPKDSRLSAFFNMNAPEREFLENQGYDAVKLENILNNSNGERPEILVLNPNLLKLADVETFDDMGNLIPLSQRHNFNINDIRYGLIPTLLGGATLYGTSNKNNASTTYATGGEINPDKLKPLSPEDNTHPDMLWHNWWLNNRADILGHNIKDTEVHPIWALLELTGLGFPGFAAIGEDQLLKLLSNAKKFTEYIGAKNTPVTWQNHYRKSKGIPQDTPIDELLNKGFSGIGATYPQHNVIVYPNLYFANRAATHERTHALGEHTPLIKKVSLIINDSYEKSTLDDYFEDPKEIYARLMEFREHYNLNPKTKVTKLMLEEWRKRGYGIGGLSIGDHLIDRYDDDVLLRLFNEVADNNALNTNDLFKNARI